jgi:hypothetical protein
MAKSPGGDDFDHKPRARRGPVGRFLAWLRLEEAGWREPPLPESGPTTANERTVRDLVDEAKFHAAFEESRLNSAQTRASWLLAFVGIIVGLAASQAHDTLLRSRGLGVVGRPLAAWSLIVAVVLLLASAGFALSVIFRAKSWVWDSDEIRKMPTYESVERDPTSVQGTFLRGLTQRILVESGAYKYLSRRLDIAFAALATGLAALAINVGVYAVRTVENPCPATLGQSSSSSLVFRAPAQATPALLQRGVMPPTRTTALSTVSADESPFPCPKGGPGTR